MSTRSTRADTDAAPTTFSEASAGAGQGRAAPLVSLLLPAYNEAAVVEKNLATLYEYMQSLEDEYRWEIVIVNDGSRDNTGELIEAFARAKRGVRVVHHPTNFGLGQALKTGFNHCRGDYIVTMDVDLSYCPDHIRRLLAKMRETGAKIVLASPYMKGGGVSSVPTLRRLLSVGANRFLSFAAQGNFSTLTGMVRAYDGRFLRTLDLKSMGMEVNPEVIYKAKMLRARIEEIPANLDWHLQRTTAPTRKSSMKVLRHTMSVLLSGFLFRPVMFFIFPGLLSLLLSLYANAWVLIHSVDHWGRLSQYPTFSTRASAAVAAAFTEAPHTFIIGGMALMVAIQLISLGILALQSKQYFEEVFHLGTTIFRDARDRGEEKQ